MLVTAGVVTRAVIRALTKEAILTEQNQALRLIARTQLKGVSRMQRVLKV